MLPSYSLPRIPEGISFEIGELIMLRNWADNNRVRLTLELDHLEGNRIYEELIRLRPNGREIATVTMWRAPHAVIVVPPGLLSRRWASMAEALASLHVQNGEIALRRLKGS